MASLILISGPPRSGKDTLATWLSHVMDYKVMKFARPIERALQGFFGMNHHEFNERRNKLKDEPWQLLQGKSFRNCMQSFSEDWAKQYGSDIFGRIAAYNVVHDRDEGFNRFVFSDCGFTEEVAPVIRRFMVEEVILVKLFRDGCTYEGDTRNYPDVSQFDGIEIREYHNNGTEADLFDFGETLIEGEL